MQGKSSEHKNVIFRYSQSIFGFGVSAYISSKFRGNIWRIRMPILNPYLDLEYRFIYAPNAGTIFGE
jgi:hypothetical protein